MNSNCGGETPARPNNCLQCMCEVGFLFYFVVTKPTSECNLFQVLNVHKTDDKKWKHTIRESFPSPARYMLLLTAIINYRRCFLSHSLFYHTRHQCRVVGSLFWSFSFRLFSDGLTRRVATSFYFLCSRFFCLIVVVYVKYMSDCLLSHSRKRAVYCDELVVDNCNDSWFFGVHLGRQVAYVNTSYLFIIKLYFFPSRVGRVHNNQCWWTCKCVCVFFFHFIFDRTKFLLYVDGEQSWNHPPSHTHLHGDKQNYTLASPRALIFVML